MLKMIFLVRKRPDLDYEEFHRYWRETHAPIAAKIPGLRKYVQNHAVESAKGTNDSFDGCAEMWFDSKESLSTPEARTALEDTANFLDSERSPSFVIEDVTIV